MVETIFYLLCGHALFDWQLQSDTMVQRKKRKPFILHPDSEPWWWWMTAHSLIVSIPVTLVTGHWLTGLAYAASHWVVDCLKSEDIISSATDQLLHIMVLAWIGVVACLLR